MKICDRCHTTYPTEFTTCPKDQTVLRSATELAEGTVLRGKYEVLEKIGAGGMAVVYRVRHLHLQEEVAIKVVNAWVAEDAQFLERFKTEAVVTRKLRHPNAVRVDDFDTTEDGRPFIVMEYVRGKSLRELLKKQGCLAPALAADIARQVALALGAAHELGIVHRDVKPENILLVPRPDGGELVKVLDFGIAKINRGAFDGSGGHTPTQTGIVLGTPQYVSPEQARGKRGPAEVDGRADLYTLGVVLYEMLTGRLPFTADSPFDMLLQHLETTPAAPHLVDPGIDISQQMSDLVMKALEKDPRNRFQSAAEMVAALADPEVVTSKGSSAHVFSTELLAAAAASIENSGTHNPASTHARAATLPLHAAASVEASASAAQVPHVNPTPAKPSFLVEVATGGKNDAKRQRKQPRRKKWMAGAMALAAILLIAALVLIFRRNSPAAGTGVAVIASPSMEKSTPANRTRPPVPRRRSSPDAAPRPAPDAAQHIRAQELVATGYRRMQQRDFEAAHDAFAEALEIEPGNPAAQKGLKSAETAQSVQGLAGVFRN